MHNGAFNIQRAVQTIDISSCMESCTVGAFLSHDEGQNKTITHRFSDYARAAPLPVGRLFFCITRKWLRGNFCNSRSAH